MTDDGVALGSTVSARETAKVGTGGRGLEATAPGPRMEEEKARIRPYPPLRYVMTYELVAN